MQDVIIKKENKTLVAEIKCEIDHHTAKGIREKIDKELLLHRPSELVIDFSAVGFMDSSGIGLILGRVDKVTSMSARIRLVGLRGIIRKLIKMSGVEKIQCISVE